MEPSWTRRWVCGLTKNKKYQWRSRLDRHMVRQHQKNPDKTGSTQHRKTMNGIAGGMYPLVYLNMLIGNKEDK